jgi:hypothetical protein
MVLGSQRCTATGNPSDRNPAVVVDLQPQA